MTPAIEDGKGEFFRMYGIAPTIAPESAAAPKNVTGAQREIAGRIMRALRGRDERITRG